ncbi:MAG TPA: DegT/DnrJ/EryC1/StrS aminotransferase family protein [Thermodesulfobacteriota bacterium]|jgi:perosamine synthetase|nr:DegT/DnrJ/EryC1/StrS aminotransferase family protein [Thermodesulfobacteriota bacterium]
MSNNRFLPFAMPSITEDEIQAVVETLRTGWITTGPRAKQFEEDFAKFIGCKYAVAVNSCTAALHLALEAIGIREGDEIITSPMTFAATGEVIRYFKARPLLVDIDSERMNLDTELLENVVRRRCESESRKKVKAIIPVHYAGYPCDMETIMALASRYDLKVVEDAAHSFPTYYKQRMIGTIGDITCFSFYATKNITTGEGGMITTENEEYADRVRIMSLHGISKDAWKRYTAEGDWYYEIIAPGYKYNLTDIAAALGIAQLKRVDIFMKRRRQIADMYHEAFQGLDELELPLECKGEKGTSHSWHLYVIRLNLQRLQIDRTGFIEELKRMGIGTSVHFIPLHIHPYYRDVYGYRPDDFPVAFETYKRIISLPIYSKMTDPDVERVIEAVMHIAKSNRR